jgi:hypothetical protein
MFGVKMKKERMWKRMMVVNNDSSKSKIEKIRMKCPGLTGQ